MKKVTINKVKYTAQRALNGLLSLLVFFGEENGPGISCEKEINVKVDKKIKVVLADREIIGHVTKVGKKYLELRIDENHKVNINVDKIWYVVDTD